MTKFNPWLVQKEIEKLEKEGVIYADKTTGWKFRLRRLSAWNEAFARAYAIINERAEYVDLNERSKVKGYVSNEADTLLDDKRNKEAYVRGTIVKWDVTGEDGAKLPLTPENGILVMDTFPRLWSSVVTFVTDGANYGEKSAPEEATAETEARAEQALGN